MVSRTIAVWLKANTADFKAQMGQASKSLEDVAAKSDKTGKVAQTHLGRLTQSAQLQRESWNAVSTGLLKFSAVGVAAVGVAVKKFADFDQAMSSVQAATHESAANMELLRSAAITAGADTQYSATEAAGAIEELAKAGISTADILNGGLAGALNLAAAGGLEVGQAAEIAATALTQFKLKGSDVGHVADLLAAGAGKAQGDVTDLGMALKQSGLVASQTGLSIEETTGALSAFASAGLIGSDAGTSFKSMLQRLTPQSKEAQALMDQLGISAYDAQGKFIGLTAFAGNLHDSLKGLTDQQRNSAMATIFGSDAVRAAAVLYDQGADGVAKWQAAVDDSGFAAETAAARTDNLKGDIERLGGSLETALIQSGSGANDVLRGLVQTVGGAVDAFGELPTPIQQGVTGLVAFTAGAAGIIGISMKVFTSLTDLKTAFDSLKGSTGILGGIASKLSSSVSLGGIALAAAPALLAVGGALAVVANNAAESDRRVSTLASTLDQATGAITDNTRAQMAQNLQSKGLFRYAEKYGISLRDLTDAAMGNSSAQKSVAKQLAATEEKMRAANDASGKGRTLTEEQRTALGDFEVALRDSGAELDDAQAKQRQMAEATGDTTDAQAENADATAGATGAIEDQTDALQELIDAQLKASGNILSTRDAQRQFQQALVDASDALTNNGQNLDITTEKGRENQKALDGIASSALDVVDAMIAEQGTHANIQPVLDDAKQKYINMATAMGMGSEEAQQLADKLFAIPTEIKPKADLQDNATSPLKQIANRIASTPDHTSFIGINNGASGPLLTINQQIANLPSEKRIRVVLDQVGFVSPSIPSSIRKPGAATGGAITGPGTGTSDSILMRLSNGEHVLTARDVQAMGGQSGVYRFRAALQAGQVPGYASGGAVPREARVPASFYSQPRVSVAAPQVQMPSVLALYAEDGTFMGNMRTVARTEAIRVGQSRNR